ncbi:uncharacterized protein LOC141657211 [Silene latifolia]|uniref:uncharacterized protein LOC141657211 n=1 Tax=Silene latifolia TaxID=37657 RepID=UPI003D78493A
MVKGVVGEEERLSLAEQRLSTSGEPAEVGLLIGKLSRESDRGYIFDLAPTPSNETGQRTCFLVNKDDSNNKKKKNTNPSNSSPSSSLVIDMDWVAEHAREVSRMMVGGITVVGVYLWAPEAAFKNSTLLLSQTVKGVADAAPRPKNGSDEMLLLHISYSPRRWTCRSCSLSSNITSSSLRPCDFKMGRVLNSLQAFRCIYKLDMRLPVFSEDFSGTRTVNDILRDTISIHAKELKDAIAMVDGDLVTVTEDLPCTSDKLHEVELLVPFMKHGSLEASNRKEVVGVLVFCGTVCSYSYLSPKEPVSQVVADIKEDITRSLRTRLDIIAEEAEREMPAACRDESETNSEMPDGKSVYQMILKPLRKEIVLPFPRRVFIPWLTGSFVCDYLLPSETFEAVRDHFVELLSIDTPTDDSFMEPEKELPNLTARSFWDATTPLYRASDDAVNKRKSRVEAVKGDANNSVTSGNIKGIFAAFILLIAVIIGSLLFARNSSEL